MESAAAYVILVGMRAVPAHAKLKVDFGWLEYVLASPRYHRWHHARDMDCVDVNYAIHLPVVDRLMGTFERPPPDVWPEEYGVIKPETVPRGFFHQALVPIRAMRHRDGSMGRPSNDDPPVGLARRTQQE